MRDRWGGSQPSDRGLRLLLVGLVTSACLVLVGIAVTLGLGQSVGHRTAIPACEDLPSMAEVTDALARGSDVVDALLAIGPEVRVQAEDPCGDGRDRGVVSVSYRTREQREAIHELFGSSEPLGVPAQVVR